MIKTETILHKICDLCGKEVDIINEDVRYPVIFMTEQDEGRTVTPYIETVRLDLCDICFGKVLKIKAYGAQGNNKYEYWE